MIGRGARRGPVSLGAPAVAVGPIANDPVGRGDASGRDACHQRQIDRFAAEAQWEHSRVEGLYARWQELEAKRES